MQREIKAHGTRFFYIRNFQELLFFGGMTFIRVKILSFLVLMSGDFGGCLHLTILEIKCSLSGSNVIFSGLDNVK